MHSLFAEHKEIILRTLYVIGVAVIVVGIMLAAIQFQSGKPETKQEKDDALSQEQRDAIKQRFDEVRAGKSTSQEEKDAVYNKINEPETELSHDEKNTIINSFNNNR